MLDAKICERARLARDARFDGLFFTGVLSTGIFCRPVCPASPPKPENVVYFPSAAAAVKAGLRPCLRCRPEAAPGTPAWNGTSATVARAIHLIRQGALNAGSVEALAARLGVGGRHLRRLFKAHVGAAPIAMANLQRALFGKKLLAETALPVTEIAFACGFNTIRRFNAAFRATYGQSPTAFRRTQMRRPPGSSGMAGFKCRLSLPYRPPYQWQRMLAFFRDRAIQNIETVDEKIYQRTIRYNKGLGAIRVSHARTGYALVLELELTDIRGLMIVVDRVRRMFDLDVNMDAVASTLAADERLRPIIDRLPGLRLPGAWNPFETAVRAIVGQQISVKAARTILGRIVERAGPIANLDQRAGPMHFFPSAEELACCDLTGLGMTGKRLKTLKELAQGVAAGGIDLTVGNGLSDFIRRMLKISGIGPWTAQYIAMRALGEPDAFPAGDLGIAQALAQNGRRPTAGQIRARAESWRPWRAYAATYLWNA